MMKKLMKMILKFINNFLLKINRISNNQLWLINSIKQIFNKNQINKTWKVKMTRMMITKKLILITLTMMILILKFWSLQNKWVYIQKKFSNKCLSYKMKAMEMKMTKMKKWMKRNLKHSQNKHNFKNTSTSQTRDLTRSHKHRTKINHNKNIFFHMN